MRWTWVTGGLFPHKVFDLPDEWRTCSVFLVIVMRFAVFLCVEENTGFLCLNSPELFLYLLGCTARFSEGSFLRITAYSSGEATGGFGWVWTHPLSLRATPEMCANPMRKFFARVTGWGYPDSSHPSAALLLHWLSIRVNNIGFNFEQSYVWWSNLNDCQNRLPVTEFKFKLQHISTMPTTMWSLWW